MRVTAPLGPGRNCWGRSWRPARAAGSRAHENIDSSRHRQWLSDAIVSPRRRSGPFSPNLAAVMIARVRAGAASSSRKTVKYWYVNIFR
jgi:hypothetical protein